MHAEVKVLMRGTRFPDESPALGMGCEEEEVRGTSGFGARKPLIERKTVEGCSRRRACPAGDSMLKIPRGPGKPWRVNPHTPGRERGGGGKKRETGLSQKSGQRELPHLHAESLRST